MRRGTQDRGRSGRRTGAAAAALLLLLGLGCLNLDLPTVPATPPPPYLEVVTPKPGDTISLTTQVSVAAASVNGISRVTVLCGPDAGARTIYTWVAPPYLALVDFALCEGLTSPNPDGGNPILPLSVQALSDAGARQEVPQDGGSFTVFLNSKGPVLTIEYPPSAQPKAPFVVQVTSDLPLRSFPEVTLDAQPASTVSAVQNDAGAVTYVVSFLSTPGLGTDNYPYTPGLPVPIEVLEETSRTVRLAVSATAQSGNSTQVDLGVELTRVVWDRYIPGLPASSGPTTWAVEPLVFAGGLIVPLATSTPTSSTSEWIPGLLRHDDGTFSGFDTSLIGGLDAGYVARGLNAQGQTLFFNFNSFTGSSRMLLAPPPGVSSPVLRSDAGPPSANAPLTRVDNLVCLQDGVTACSATATESLTCFDPQLKPVTVSAGPVSTGPPSPGVVGGAGGRYLSPTSPVCGSSWNLVDLLSATISYGPLNDFYTGCPVQDIPKLLPLSDGTFIVQVHSACPAAVPVNYWPIERIGPGSSGSTSQLLGTYTAPAASPPTVQHEVVGALADGRVVTLSNTPPYTSFELWGLNSTSPDVVTPVSGLYDTGDSALGSVLAESVFSGVDGSFAVLLSGATLGVGVLAFGPNLQPLWLYVYPRTADASNSRLVSAPNVGDVYLLDEFNNRAISLRARPVSAAPTGITVHGVVSNQSGAPALGIAVVVSSANGTQNATSDASGAFTFNNVQVPYTLSAVDLLRGDVTSYQGLTIPNPTIQHALLTSNAYNALINVVLDGGISPPPANYVTELQFVSPEEVGTGSNGPPTIGFTWYGPSSTTGRLSALEIHLSDAGYNPFIPVDFPGYATVPGIVAHNGDALNESLLLLPVTPGTISGTLTPPPGATAGTLSVSLVSEPNSPYGITVVNDSTLPTSFSYLTPNIPGTSLLLHADYNDNAGNHGIANLVGLAANTSNLAVPLPTAPALLTPANNATGVTTATQLSCSTFSGGIYHFVMQPDGYGQYDIWSTSPTATIPDLTVAGVPLPQNNGYQWWVEGTAPLSSVDQLAAPYSGSTFVGKSAFWYFTTSP